ncbi:MAG: hypothetical protein EKK42_04560 [Pseudonocardiaceae bacterium]|nr:MAG: hypothetical protein EKK42_04560 [Pseudonocardiaceae bacterium]
MNTRIVLRVGLLVLAATQAFVGLWALPAPRSFYDDFPAPGRSWVSALPPYNEHLVRDVGALSLALTVLLVAAAIWLDRRLVAITLVGSASGRSRTSSSTASTCTGSVHWTPRCRRSGSRWRSSSQWSSPSCWPARRRRPFTHPNDVAATRRTRRRMT